MEWNAQPRLPSNLDDWIQILVVGGLVLASVISGAMKQFFGKPKEQQPQGDRPKYKPIPADGPREHAATPPPVPPAQPIRRSLPDVSRSRPQPSALSRPATGPRPARVGPTTVLDIARKAAEEARRRSREKAAAVAKPLPVAKPTLAEHLPSMLAGKQTASAAAPHVSLEERERGQALLLARRMGHVHEGVVSSPKEGAGLTMRRRVPRLTPKALRRAILLNEILGPPLSLRPPEEI